MTRTNASPYPAGVRPCVCCDEACDRQCEALRALAARQQLGAA